VAEIGRFKGGTTLMLASALPEGAELWSYDLHVALRADLSGAQLDSELEAALSRYGLTERVHLVVGDSRTAEPPPRPCALIFVDGDHTYEGARADYERWREFLAAGGDLLFHDAVDVGGYGNHYPGIARLVSELERDDENLERQPNAGSIAHFVRRP
jgi:predicted O-methyltransferase YrrM